MSQYNHWETTESISGVIKCGTSRKVCMRMKGVKRRKGEPFGKQFEGVHWEKAKGSEEDVRESLTMRRKIFL